MFFIDTYLTTYLILLSFKYNGIFCEAIQRIKSYKEFFAENWNSKMLMTRSCLHFLFFSLQMILLRGSAPPKLLSRATRTSTATAATKTCATRHTKWRLKSSILLPSLLASLQRFYLRLCNVFTLVLWRLTSSFSLPSLLASLQRFYFRRCNVFAFELWRLISSSSLTSYLASL